MVSVAAMRPPITARPRKRFPRALAGCQGHGDHAGDHGKGGHENGAESAGGAFDGGQGGSGRPGARLRLGERDQENRVGHGDADRHDRAHERLNIQRGLRHSQHDHDTGDDGRHDQDDGQREAEALKIGRQQQKDHYDGDDQAVVQAAKKFLHGGDLAADIDGDAGGRVARIFGGLLQIGCDAAEIFAGDIGPQREHAGHVVAVVLAQHGAVGYAGDLAHLQLPRTVDAGG